MSMKSSRSFLNYITRSPLHLSLFAVIASAVITGVMVTIFIGFNPASLILALSISTICAGPLSYITTRYVFSIRRQLEAQNAELLAMNRDLNTFAHTVAHDLKNPLSNMIGYTALLREQHPTMSDDEVNERLRRIETSGRKLVTIIDELLLLARIRNEDVHKSVVDMKAVVEQARDRLEKMIEDFNAELEIPDEFPPVVGYAPWIEEIWANYISNGIKYGGQPPRVKVGAAVEPDGNVRFWVKDNGQGLAPEDQDRLFHQFTRLEQHVEKAAGTGLGLAIVQQITEKLGGQVGVQSSVGEGSKFYFILPAAGKSST